MTAYTDEYYQFCTSDRQKQVLKEVIARGVNKASIALQVNPRTVERILQSVRLNAARRGFAPSFDMIHPTPPTHVLKGTSTLYRADGSVAQQWVKTDRAESELAEALKATAEALREDLPRYKPQPAPKKHLLSDLQNVYVITDYHIGMLSWGEETGADWDTDIAERTLLAWFEQAIRQSPDAESAVFAQLGDFLHWDGLVAVTPTSGHVLDADTRFQRVVRVAIRVIRRIISRLLAKHRHVTVIMADANHDPASGVWLREWLASVYQDEPRVTVDNSADTYYAVEFGSVLTMYHHGHKRGVKDLAPVLVAKFREAYGRTKFHYAHTGHLHHDVVNECALMRKEQHRTLAAQDAYASRSGFLSGRDAKVITYHRKYGEVGRLTISYEMVAA